LRRYEVAFSPLFFCGFSNIDLYYSRFKKAGSEIKDA